MTEEIVRYQPKAALASRKTLAGLLEAQKAELARIMPNHVPVDRLIKMALLAVNRQPDLLECTQESVISAVMQSAELGLDIGGTLGDAYPVKFKNACVLIVGYRGLAKLARQSGLVKRIEADVVRASDAFEIRRGTVSSLTHVPALENRGEVVGAWALAELFDGGVQFEYLSREEIEKVRHTSRAPNSLMWTTFFEEGAKKTAFRRLAKWLPLSSQDSKHRPLIDAIEASDMGEFDFSGAPQVIVQQDDEPKAKAMARKIRAERERRAEQASEAGRPEPWEPNEVETEGEVVEEEGTPQVATREGREAELNDYNTPRVRREASAIGLDVSDIKNRPEIIAAILDHEFPPDEGATTEVAPALSFRPAFSPEQVEKVYSAVKAHSELSGVSTDESHRQFEEWLTKKFGTDDVEQIDIRQKEEFESKFSSFTVVKVTD